MELTINETNRRREIQKEYNKINGIEPQQISKAIDNQLLINRPQNQEIDDLVEMPKVTSNDPVLNSMGRDDLENSINKLKKQMESEAKKENFMQAAMMRDELFKLKKLLLEKFD